MLTGIVLLALALVALVLGLRWLEPYLTYFPAGAPVGTPGRAGLPYEDVRIATEDGETLHGWWIDAAVDDRAGGPVLLFLHGNAGSREHRLHNLQGLHAAGIATLIVDYRGFGGSTGRPSEEGLHRDALAAFDWLAARVAPRPVACFGRSLGAAVAARLATVRPCAALVLESPFTTAREMARRVLPLPGIGWIARARYDVLAAVRSVTVPLLVIHGEADEVVPFAMGRRVFEAAASPDKAFHAVPGGTHNDTYVVAGRAYWPWLREFLAPSAR